MNIIREIPQYASVINTYIHYLVTCYKVKKIGLTVLFWMSTPILLFFP